MTRPRARHLDGSGEVELATYKHFSTEDLLGQMNLALMVAGLSTRNYRARSRAGRRRRGDRDQALVGVVPLP